MRKAGWVQVVVGIAGASLWVMLLTSRQVPVVQQGRVDIWFHIAAELGMAGS